MHLIVSMHLLAVWAAGLPLDLLAQVPDPPPQAPPGFRAPVNTILGWMKWGGLGAGFAGLIIAGAQMGIGRKGHHRMANEGPTGIAWALAGVTTISFGAGLIGALLQS